MKKIIRTGKAQSTGPSIDPNTIKSDDVMISRPISSNGTHLGIKINLN
jgi:hypothetical protein